jgi:hypothetical protein
MQKSESVKNLELALIELKYAVSDFAQRKASAIKPDEADELDGHLARLVAAKCMIEVAIGVLGCREQPDMPNRAA